MKEHLLAIVFLVLLFLLYLAPLPDSFLNNINKNYHQEEEQEDLQEQPEQEHNAIIPAAISRDSTRASVASATRYKNL